MKKDLKFIAKIVDVEKTIEAVNKREKKEGFIGLPDYLCMIMHNQVVLNDKLDKLINKNNMKEFSIWGKVEGEDITLQIKGEDFKTKEVTMPIKAIPPVMIKLTKHKIDENNRM